MRGENDSRETYLLLEALATAQVTGDGRLGPGWKPWRLKEMIRCGLQRGDEMAVPGEALYAESGEEGES